MRVMRRHRGLAALIALGYLLGYLLVFVHFIAEQHAACAEHGVAHHVDSDDEPDRAPLAAGIAATPGSVDDHCHALTTVRGHAASAALPAPTWYPVTDPVTREDHARDVQAHGIAVWRYAPKQSPPAHA